jgi:hypothetical protein
MQHMALRTPSQYIQSLRDDRTVYFRGQRVPEVTQHPAIRVGIYRKLAGRPFRRGRVRRRGQAGGRGWLG